MEGYTEVFAWGGDHFGQLGLGGKVTGKTYSSPRFCSFNILIKDISCGEEHSGFISYSGHIYTMGSNADGRLGIGSRTIKQSPSPCLVEELGNYNCVKISCGWGHTAVITENGEVFSWGVGEYGALGTGHTDNKWVPTLVPLKGNAIDLSCGSRHTGIVIQERTGQKVLAMCGGGEAGQLGTGKREKELYPIIIDTSDNVEQVSCGVFHSAFVTNKGYVYTMGGNSFGQLGLGNKKSQSKPEKVVNLENTVITKVRCSNFTAALSDKGYLYIWGSGIFGEYLLPHRWSMREPIIDLSIGSGFGVAIDSLNSVYVWGNNSSGELGLDDYDPRLTPTLLPSLKGKSILKISSGGNFCLGLGNDIIPRNKTPERTKKSAPEVRRSEEITEIRNKTRPDEVEKLSFEIKQTYRSYEEIKKNFEILSEKYEADKRNNEKHIEELNREIFRYKQEIERFKSQIDLDNREIRELNDCVQDIKKNNFDYNSQVDLYKDELLRAKRTIEDLKQFSRLDLKKLEDKKNSEASILEEKVIQETLRRKQLEKELERSNSMIFNYENTIRKFENEINDISIQLQQNIQTSELEKKKMQAEIEKCYKDIHNLSKKNEYFASEKDKVQNSSKYEIDKLSKENIDLKRKLESALSEISLNESLKHELNRVRNENTDCLNKIETLYIENERIQSAYQLENENSNKINNELKQRLEYATYEIQKNNNLASEFERATKENINLQKKIDYLIIDKEKVASNLSAEIDEIESQNSTLLQQYDQLTIEKEKKTQTLSSEIEKFSRENFELKKKVELISMEKEKLYAEINSLSEDLKSLKHQNEKLSIESHNLTLRVNEISHEASEAKSRMSYSMSDKDNLISKQKSDLEIFAKEINDLKRITEVLKQEKNNYTDSTKLELSNKSSEISKLYSQLSMYERENTSITKLSTDQAADIKKYQEINKSLISENNLFKQSVEDMRYEIETLHQQKVEQDYLYRNLQESQQGLENKFAQVLEENNSYRIEINDLEEKNRQLFENLERELAQRAKEYKERTISILSTPLRTNSPHLRPPTPSENERFKPSAYNRTHTPASYFDRNRKSEDLKGNTAARLLQTLEDSPRPKKNDKLTKTPTKEDIKAKIATLMQNRNRLESELSRFEEA
jgi:X-linked retinitis pigmentosa GTPase regulator